MKRFEFTLERVLEFRRLQASTERARLDEILAQRAPLVVAQERLSEEGRAVLRYGAKLPVEFSARDNYSQFVRRQQERLEAQMVEIDKRAAAQRTKVMEAERRCDLLEKLKQRRQTEWTVAADRELEELAADSFRARLHASRRARVQEG